MAQTALPGAGNPPRTLVPRAVRAALTPPGTPPDQHSRVHSPHLLPESSTTAPSLNFTLYVSAKGSLINPILLLLLPSSFYLILPEVTVVAQGKVPGAPLSLDNPAPALLCG